MTNLFEIENARKAYESFTLDDVCLKLPPGYIMGLIGPNGSGKTTLIKLIMNVVRRDGGTIRLFGSDNLRQAENARARIGFVQDEPTFYGHLTLASMKSIVAGFYESWDEEAFLRLIDRFDLPLSKRVMALSRGMTTKFALSLALSHRAELLVLDEPTSGLDPGARRELLTILAEYIEDGTRSVLFSTHITSDLERVADFVTLLQAGKLVFSSAKDDILDNWALVKGGNQLLTAAARDHLEGCREGEHGFEALTSRGQDVQQHFDGDVLVEKASLEDIMFYTTPRHQGGTCSR
ncbi:MAG TPA: ABC transporter ATP-binding protein [Pirellulaceae bacterium]|jgi:ABC-2 type transport system ATP-binding protein|nr:ABC transporter ATP-binding protein [Pirellulaceae bacterium]